MTLKELHTDYCKWRALNNTAHIGKQHFSKILEQKGFRKTKTGGKTVFYGIDLKGMHLNAF